MVARDWSHGKLGLEALKLDVLARGLEKRRLALDGLLLCH